jgi:hypothetical protein
MLRRTALAFGCGALLLWSACGGNPAATNDARSATAGNASAQQPAAPSPTPPAQVVTAATDEVRLRAGGTGETIVTLKIADGYHVNANPPSDKFYVGTEIKAEPQDGVTPGRPTYPKGESKKFEFSDQPLLVYEGEAVIRLPLSAAAGAAKGARTFAARVRVQPCNDEACLPPREIEANVPVVIE